MNDLMSVSSAKFSMGLPGAQAPVWIEPSARTERRPAPMSLDAVVALLANLDEAAPSPADPTPPVADVGRIAGLFCLLATAAGVLTWQVI